MHLLFELLYYKTLSFWQDIQFFGEIEHVKQLESQPMQLF
jgi:hypothetical protein